MSGLLAELNRLAGTNLGASGAANVYAGTTRLELVGALNVKAGTTGLELQGVCNHLAGTTGLGVLEALSRVERNAMVNPSFETDLTDWTAERGTLTRVTSTAHSGTASARFDSDTAVTGARFIQSGAVPVVAGHLYTASAFVQNGATFTDVTIQVNWRSSGGFLSSDFGTADPIGASFIRTHVTATAPTDAIEATVGIRFTPDPGATAAHTFTDAVMFEPGILTEYSD